MIMRNLFLLLIISSSTIYRGISQENTRQYKDTIQLMNGETMVANVTDTSFYGAKIYKPGRKKEMLLEGEGIFSIKFPNGYEKIVYYFDTLIGNDLTVEEARYFIKGEQDADRNFSAKGALIGGILVGGASGAFGSLLSLVPPFLYAGAVMIPNVKIKQSDVSDPKYLQQETYVMGFERVARRKRTLNALTGGAIGLVIGFIGHSVYNNVK